MLVWKDALHPLSSFYSSNFLKIIMYITSINQFFSRYQSFDALKDVPKNFGRVGEEEMAETIAFAWEAMTIGGAFVGMTEIACEKDFFQ